MRKLVRLALVLVRARDGRRCGPPHGRLPGYAARPRVLPGGPGPQPVEQKAAADQLEREVLELHNEARKPGRWEARFSQEQINGWLAADLPVKFPGHARRVSAPRVAIEPGRMQFAVRYDHGEISTVLSLAGDAYLTDRPNEVAIHIEHVRAGAFPVPLAQFLDDIAERAGEAGLPLRWTEEGRRPGGLGQAPAGSRGIQRAKAPGRKPRNRRRRNRGSGRTEGPADSQPAESEPAESQAEE